MGDNERLYAVEPPFTIENISVASGSRTPDRQISRPALSLVSYLDSGADGSLMNKGCVQCKPSLRLN